MRMTPMKFRFVGLLPLMVLGLMPSCGGGGGGGYSSPPPLPPPPSNTVMVGQTGAYGTTSNVFSPVNLSVGVGTTVTWTWVTSGHTVDSGPDCSPDGRFSSHGAQAAGFTMTHQFNTAGTYPYLCTTHCGVGMKGTITVQ